jgi:uncharacterized protein YcfL
MKKLLIICILSVLLFGCDSSYYGEQYFVVDQVVLNVSTVKGKYRYVIRYNMAISKDNVTLCTDSVYKVGDTLKFTLWR